MNPGRFYMPSYIGMRNIPLSNPSFSPIGMVPRKIGLFGKITNGIRSVNWSGLLNNANKTLDVVNQTIPLVRQAGPMVNNMKSMLKIAKVFGNETTFRNNNNINNNLSLRQPVSSNANLNSNYDSLNSDIDTKTKKETQNDNTLNFFV